MTVTNNGSEIDTITNTPPSRLVVMLYDGVITALDSAIEAIEDGDIEKRCKCVNVAIEVISYLYMSLDMEKGGIISENLAKLYRFSMTQLPLVNRDNDPAMARAVIEILRPIHESWIEIDSAMSAPFILPLANENHRAMPSRARATA